MYVGFSWGEGGLYIGYNEFHDESKILAKELVIGIRLDSFLYLFHGNDKHDRFLVRLFRNGLRHQYELDPVKAIFKTVCVRAYFWNMTELIFPFNSRTAYNEVVYQWYLVLFFSTSQRFGTIEQFSAIKWVLCASLRSIFCKNGQRNVQKSMIHVQTCCFAL